MQTCTHIKSHTYLHKHTITHIIRIDKGNIFLPFETKVKATIRTTVTDVPIAPRLYLPTSPKTIRQ